MKSVLHDVQQCEGVVCVITCSIRCYLYIYNVFLLSLLLFQFEIGKHFMARVLCLIMIPIFVYLFWFAVHFKMLPKT